MHAVVPCLKCGETLQNIDDRNSPTGNQPMGGLEFVAYGHYGSGAFDPMDGSRLIINLCDKCVRTGLGNLTIKKVRPHQTR